MKTQNVNLKLVKLPPEIELLLFLIMEELKSNKFFNGLAKVGLGDCNYQSNFGTVILAYAGFDSQPDDLFNFYLELVERYSVEIEDDHNSIMEQAFNLYTDLMIEKKKRLG